MNLNVLFGGFGKRPPHEVESLGTVTQVSLLSLLASSVSCVLDSSPVFITNVYTPQIYRY